MQGVAQEHATGGHWTPSALHLLVSCVRLLPGLTGMWSKSGWLAAWTGAASVLKTTCAPVQVLLTVICLGLTAAPQSSQSIRSICLQDQQQDRLKLLLMHAWSPSQEPQQKPHWALQALAHWQP